MIKSKRDAVIYKGNVMELLIDVSKIIRGLTKPPGNIPTEIILEAVEVGLLMDKLPEERLDKISEDMNNYANQVRQTK